MPRSKKPRKKKTSSDDNNVVPFAGTSQVAETMFGTIGNNGGNPEFRAQNLIYDAWEATTAKKRVTLAKKALKIFPNCADAYNILAEHAAITAHDALQYYKRGVDAGEKAIGEEDYKAFMGHFWGFMETRPYMRALHGLGEALWATGDCEGAIETFERMLELNPGDNQGIRYILTAKLLEVGDFEKLHGIFAEYSDDGSPDIQYTRALVAFIENDSAAAEIAKEAYPTNKHIPLILSGKMPAVEIDHFITMGGVDEASGYNEIFGHTWRRTPGSIKWLCDTVEKMAD